MNHITYRLALIKLYRQKRMLDKQYKRDFAEAKKSNDREKIELVNSMASADYFEVEDEIQYTEQQYLQTVARKMLLPIPPYKKKEDGGLWEESFITGKRMLTTEGIKQLRSTIRTEKKSVLNYFPDGSRYTLV